MNANADLIFNKNGSPFTDKDAADYKARIMTSEVGERFIVTSYSGGGYVVQRDLNSKNLEEGMEIEQENDSPYISPEIPEPEIFMDELDSGQNKPVPFESLPDMTGMADVPLKNSYRDVVTTPVNDGKGKNDEPLTAAAITPPAMKAPPKSKEEQRYPSIFKLRPALRTYYLQYIVAFIGMVIYARPTWLLYTFMTEQELFFDRPKLGQVLPDLVSTLGFILAAGALLIVLINYLSYSWRITPTKIDAKIGIFNRKDGSANLDIADIKSFEPRQTVIQSVFLGTGDVMIGTPATADNEITLKNILDPDDLIAELERRKHIAQKELNAR